MKQYVVGGAVRDRLLGLPAGDRDWVVVGATAAHMRAQKFRSVGKAFPVFLHPVTGEEYALARRERKNGSGHTAFSFDTDPTITLEEDLCRRDLTVNAIAEEVDGTLIDPYGGVRDLEDRVLRHVSPAFAEDPLRVLRTARFYARFAAHGFRIADETVACMRAIVQSGELATLSSERIVGEWAKALRTDRPQEFFAVLRDTGALDALFPDVFSCAAFDTQQAALARVANMSDALDIRFATSLVSGNKQAVDQLSTRYILPKKTAHLVRLSGQFHDAFTETADAAALMRLLRGTDAVRRPEYLQKWVLVQRACEGATSDDVRVKRISAARDAYISIDAAAVAVHTTKESVAAGLHKARFAAVWQAIQ